MIVVEAGVRPDDCHPVYRWIASQSKCKDCVKAPQWDTCGLIQGKKRAQDGLLLDCPGYQQGFARDSGVR